MQVSPSIRFGTRFEIRPKEALVSHNQFADELVNQLKTAGIPEARKSFTSGGNAIVVTNTQPGQDSFIDQEQTP